MVEGKYFAIGMAVALLGGYAYAIQQVKTKTCGSTYIADVTKMAADCTAGISYLDMLGYYNGFGKYTSKPTA